MAEQRETFGGWLAKQEHREDEVGMMARHWKSIKDEYPKVRALPSIQRELQSRGDLNQGSPVAGWWALTIEAYRGKDSPAPQMGAVPDAETALMAEQAAEVRHDSHMLLELVNDKLDWLYTALMAQPDQMGDLPPWPQLPGPDGAWTWDHLHEVADFEADEAQQG